MPLAKIKGFEVEFKRALDKANRILFSNDFSTNYNHCVDMASVAGSTASQRSIVDNWKFGDELKVNYRLNDDYEFTFHTGLNYYLIRSKRVGFENINASDYNIGLNATDSIALGITINYRYDDVCKARLSAI